MVKEAFIKFSFANKEILVMTSFGGSGSGSRTDSDILAVLGPVLKDFCSRVRFSGTWTDPGTTLPLTPNCA